MTQIPDFQDWAVEDGDLVFQDGDILTLLGANAVGSQIENMLRTKGTVYELVNCEESDKALILTEVMLEIESDKRVIPGSVTVEHSGSNINYEATLTDKTIITGLA